MKYGFYFFVISLMLSCGYASNETIRAFDIVDNSITKSNERIDKSFNEKISALNNEEKDRLKPFLLSRSHILDKLDSLIIVLENRCTSEADLDCAMELMIEEKNYELLKKAFVQLQRDGNKLIEDADTSYDHFFTLFEMTGEELFEKVPAIAGITILNKCQNDCANASMYVVDKIYAK